MGVFVTQQFIFMPLAKQTDHWLNNLGLIT